MYVSNILEKHIIKSAVWQAFFNLRISNPKNPIVKKRLIFNDRVHFYILIIKK